MNYKALDEALEYLEEKVIYQGKQLDDLIDSIIKKVEKLKTVKNARKSDYHGTSLDIKFNTELNDDVFASIKKIMTQEISKMEKKYNCEYSWSVDVSTNDSCLIVFDCDLK